MAKARQLLSVKTIITLLATTAARPRMCNEVLSEVLSTLSSGHLLSDRMLVVILDIILNNIASHALASVV